LGPPPPDRNESSTATATRAAGASVATYRLLLKTTLGLRRRMRRLFNAYGLTGAQFALLTRIPDEGIPLTQLAETAWADPGNTSGVVDRLAREGWVIRTRSDKDRRVVTIHLSEKGRALLGELIPRYEEAVTAMMSRLSPLELETLHQLLVKLDPQVSPSGQRGDEHEEDHFKGER